MPNRIIKESICTSDSINKLNDREESFFYRLIVNCDDFGRMDARPAILKARLYPLKDVTHKQIVVCLEKLRSVGMVKLYEVDNKPFLQIVTWEKHQQVRSKKSKYPSIDAKDTNLISDDINCNQMISDVTVIQSNPIQSESILLSEAETAPDRTPVISLMLNDKTMHPVYQEDIDKWSVLYPAVDVVQELRNMVGWIDGNPSKRKTKSGIARFMTSWLKREQDKGRAGHMQNPEPERQVRELT